jgi:hypothetical protein
MIRVRILGHKKPQRYALVRAVVAAWMELQAEHPNLEMDISEVKDSQEILKYTPVIVYPSLMMDDKLVCVGRFPSKDEILVWFQSALSGCGEGPGR